MKKITTLLLIAAALFTMSCNNEPKTEEVAKEEVTVSKDALENRQYIVSNKESKIVWVGKKVTGQHTGIINVVAGKFAIENGAIAKGKLSIDMTSISATDLEGEDKMKLDGHLKNEDFFNVTEFPVANLEIVDGSDMNKVRGKLTIKGMTEEIIFPMSVTVTDGMATFRSKLEFDRTKFGVTYNSGNFFKDLGDYMIDDMVQMDVMLMAK